MSRARWKVARTLNRSARYCWADLVTWALGWTRLVDAKTGVRCRDESATHRDGSCYCGKFRDGCITRADP